MPAHEHLGAQFVFHAANPREMGGVSHHTVEAWAPEHAGTEWAQAHPAERGRWEGSSVDPGHRPMSSLSWHHKTGEIKGVYTAPEHQRQGLASALHADAGQRGVVAPKHSADRTTSGDAWARSVGGRLPRRRAG
jgi:GNAT superfamily N-acetyltransferase